jgi:RNA polymerase sigma factor (sigma-70 family)
MNTPPARIERVGDGMTDQDVDIAETPTSDLVTRARAGSHPAWIELVDRFTPMLWTIARRYHLNHDDAADVVQATWLRLVENLGRIREPGHIAGWLVTTCQREALRVAQVSARCSPQDTTDPSGLLARRADQDGASEPVEVVLRQEVAAILSSAVEDLPARQRNVLTALAEPSQRPRYTEVATVLSMPIGSIGPTRERALRRLRADPRLRAIREITSRPTETRAVRHLALGGDGPV